MLRDLLEQANQKDELRRLSREASLGPQGVFVSPSVRPFAAAAVLESDELSARPALVVAPDDRSASMSSEEQGGEPTEEEIRYRAYLLYIERGAGDGMDFEDWVRAERELKNRRGNSESW